MRYSIIFIIVWVLGSGVIAYLGDKIGRRMGKRRLSAFGLRPRHTATLFTVATGMLIASLTLGAIYMVNRRVAVAILRVEDLLRTTAEIEAKNRKLSERYRQSQAELAESLRRVSSAQAAAERAERERDRELERVKTLRRQILQRTKELKLLSFEVRALRTAAEQAEARAELSRRELAAVRRTLDNERRRLAAAELQLRSAERRIQEAMAREREARAAEQDAAKRRAEAEKRAGELETQVAAKTEDLRRVSSDLERTSQELNRTRGELDRAKEALDQVRKELEESQAFERWVTRGATIIRQAPIIFRANEELARRVVYKPDSAEKVRDDFARLLAVADVVAAQRGAAPAVAGGRTVKTVSITVPGYQSDLSEEQQVELLAKNIAQEGRDVVLRVVAAANTVQGEPVQATLDVRPNVRVFRRGEVIAETIVPPRTPEPRVLEAVLDLLQVKTRAAALEKGMLPTPSGTLGEASWDQILQAVRRATMRRSPCRVQVLAAADVWTADPLLILLRVQ